MDWVLMACVAVLAVGVAWLAVRPSVERASTLGQLVERRRVIVNLKSGSSVEGVVWSTDRGWMVIKHAALLEQRGPTPVDGEVVVEVANVDFVQALPPAAG